MNRLFFLVFLLPLYTTAQTLTVEKIMRDPKWIGAQPQNAFWGIDSRTVYFDWNPELKAADSSYRFTLADKTAVKAAYRDALLQEAMADGNYNKTYTQLVYSYRGDLFLFDLKSNKTSRLTETEEAESSPSFIRNDEWILFNRNQNVYAWQIKTGAVKQLTNFVRNSTNNNAPRLSKQDELLQQQQLQMFDVLRERKTKRDDRAAFFRNNRDTDTLKAINIGDKILRSHRSQI